MNIQLVACINNMVRGETICPSCLPGLSLDAAFTMCSNVIMQLLSYSAAATDQLYEIILRVTVNSSLFSFPPCSYFLHFTPEIPASILDYSPSKQLYMSSGLRHVTKSARTATKRRVVVGAEKITARQYFCYIFRLKGRRWWLTRMRLKH